jgi:hypothetical protein
MRIIHGAPDALQAETYEPGSIIELTEEEAERLGNNVSPADGDSPDTMTVAQLTADLVNFFDQKELKGKKKDELMKLWTETRDVLKAMAG